MKVIRIIKDLSERNKATSFVPEYVETGGFKLFGIEIIKPIKIKNPTYEYYQTIEKYQPKSISYELEVDDYSEAMKIIQNNLNWIGIENFYHAIGPRTMQKIDLTYENYVFKGCFITSVEPSYSGNSAIIKVEVDYFREIIKDEK